MTFLWISNNFLWNQLENMRLDIKQILLNSKNFVKEKILIASITHEVKQNKDSVKLYIGYYAKAQFHHTQKPPTPQNSVIKIVKAI